MTRRPSTSARGKRADRLTRKWVKCRADELAIQAGYRFDQARADHVCEFFETELRLYEGEYAGQPFRLMDWQRALLSRAFGWVIYSEDWGREIRRFRKVSLWVPKKCGKSPLAAGVGLYLLAADGESGQKVFSAAKDGKQAAIVHTHARQMVLRSPTLNALCKINNSTGRISLAETTSIYDLLSGDNIAGQEGLNGSVVIDETHVVDDRLTKVLEYMGASRSEPMQFEVSTAGNNPEGYGKRQYDYGRQVERGDITDHEFLFVSYGIEPGLSDEECLKPATWKAANPSWGVTIKPGEFEQSARRAREKSLADWNTFKMYRLNQWQHASCPWLRLDDWRKCGAGFDLAELEGVPCAAGLDLSKTRDMSALALAWHTGGAYLLTVYHWVTERYVEATRSKLPLEQWAGLGRLEIIPGDTIRQRWIREQFEQLADRHVLDVLVYDKTYAQEFVEWVAEDFGEIQAVEYPQSAALMEGPIDDFEAAVREGQLSHENDPILNWQAGHAETKPNYKGYRVLQKPGTQEHRKIDGLVAAVMAVWGTTHVQEFAAEPFMF